jgi:hypothetical protein
MQPVQSSRDSPTITPASTPSLILTQGLTLEIPGLQLVKTGQFLILTHRRGGRRVGTMARELRVEYAGAVYHLVNRGDRREPIFRDDEDRQQFLGTLGEACGKTGWQVQALCLMPDHFHLVVETPRANLVAGMKWSLGTVNWIAERLQMGAPGYVHHLLHRRRETERE